MHFIWCIPPFAVISPFNGTRAVPCKLAKNSIKTKIWEFEQYEYENIFRNMDKIVIKEKMLLCSKNYLQKCFGKYLKNIGILCAPQAGFYITIPVGLFLGMKILHKFYL